MYASVFRAVTFVVHLQFEPASHQIVDFDERQQRKTKLSNAL